MAKGKCINFDKPCDLALSGKVQEADESNFVCEECGKPLDPVKTTPPPPPPPTKIIAAAAGAAVVLGGLGFGAYKFLRSEPTPPPTVEMSVRVTPTETTDTVGNTVALTAVTSPDGSAVVWTSSDEKTATVDGNGQVKLVKAGEVDITCVLNDSVKAVSHITSVDKAKTETTTGNGGARPSDGNYPLACGTYSGPMSGGTPHGLGGTVRINRRYAIDLKDSSGGTVSVGPGDKIVDTKFNHGVLQQGQIIFSDGTRKYVSGLAERL